jgi:hypothetical protein
MSLIDLNFHPAPRALRTFGVAAAAILALWAAPIFQRHRILAVVLFALAGSVLLLSLWRPRLLRHPYILASLITYPIGLVLSWVILALVFYLLLTPLGVLRRAVRKDPLGLRLDRAKSTYWVSRPPARQTQSYFRQY